MTYLDPRLRAELISAFDDTATEEVVVIYLDLVASASESHTRGVGVSIDRLLDVCAIVTRNFKKVLGKKFSSQHVVRSIGDEIMIAIPRRRVSTSKYEPSDQDVSRLVDAIIISINEAEQNYKAIIRQLPGIDESKYFIPIYKVSFNVCKKTISGQSIKHLLRGYEDTMNVEMSLIDRIILESDFWGSDINVASRISSLSANKVILVNERAKYILDNARSIRGKFSTTDLFDFSAKGIGNIKVAQVVEKRSIDQIPRIVRQYSFCSVVFMEVEPFSDEPVPVRKSVEEILVNSVLSNFPEPMTCFGFRLLSPIMGNLKPGITNFAFALVNQGFDDFQNRFFKVFEETSEKLVDFRSRVRYSHTYPLWQPFSREEDHPFYKNFIKGKLMADLPDTAFFVLSSLVSRSKAELFQRQLSERRFAENSEFGLDRVWTVTGDAETIAMFARYGDVHNLEVQSRFGGFIRNCLKSTMGDARDENFVTFPAQLIWPTGV